MMELVLPRSDTRQSDLHRSWVLSSEPVKDPGTQKKKNRKAPPLPEAEGMLGHWKLLPRKTSAKQNSRKNSNSRKEYRDVPKHFSPSTPFIAPTLTTDMSNAE